MPYTPEKPPLPETTDQLRARIPGWGVDLDPADRPAFPRERFDPAATGAWWDVPERQPGGEGRERSIEHGTLPPVFGTAAPLKGLSGVVRRLAYRRFSEGRLAHWLLLIAGDRIDVVESTVTSALRGKPDNLVAETGIRAETWGHGIKSRRGRVDTRHHLVDPVIVAGPWVAGGVAAALGVRRAVRAARR